MTTMTVLHGAQYTMHSSELYPLSLTSGSATAAAGHQAKRIWGREDIIGSFQVSQCHCHSVTASASRCSMRRDKPLTRKDRRRTEVYLAGSLLRGGPSAKRAGAVCHGS